MKGTTTLLHPSPSKIALQKADDAYPTEEGKKTPVIFAELLWLKKNPLWMQMHQLVCSYIPKNTDA